MTTTAVVRNKDYERVLKKLGADEVVIRDITEQSTEDWARLFEGYDCVIWSAGNGGRSGPEVTTAVDRDGELRVIEALDTMDEPPFYLTIGYYRWDRMTSEADPATNSWAAYVEAKRAVGERLSRASFSHTILAPAKLTVEPSRGGRPIPNDSDIEDATTSRELVADTLVEHVLEPKQTSGTYAFVDS
ncbi:NADPH:quinone reductase-like Zn-dependent oxidoreductase [Corynebacterium guangdongense]|uniref:NADPH:quinone reductase-like Zn-dependent oxidoreductase n=1 Tax=Corynebacterium guangdongense TaxID=1783348 RepID=A0ABU1ZWR3_9CORY|nr:NADPH:quinone reductase-like Zn-dependent oxidoreductase [Corynebacterium guangdongense]